MVTATVTGYDRDDMLLRVDRAACAACLEGRGCGMGLLAGDSRRFRELRQTAPAVRPEVGAVVELKAQRSVLAATSLAYGLPLMGLVSGASIGDWLLATPGAVLGGGVSMLLMALLASRLAGRFFSAGCGDTVRTA